MNDIRSLPGILAVDETNCIYGCRRPLLQIKIICPYVFWCILSSLFAGCAVGPDYTKPKMSVPASWSEVQQTALPVSGSPVVQWWKTFHDPVLNSLITQAMDSNPDLRIARARVREARAQRGVVSADLWPSIDSSASYSGNRRSLGSPTIPTFVPVKYDLFQARFDASWEIDIFGGTRRAVEAANADIDAAVENQRGVLVTLLAEVALNYIETRGFQYRLEIIRKNIRTQQETVEITRSKFRAGLSSELDVTQAESLLAATQAQAPVLENSLKQAIHQIGILLGQNPGALLDALLKESSIPVSPPAIPVGLPSDLLQRRPDIRSSERQIASATAQIGVATSDLFPRFSLTGNFGLQSGNWKNFTSTGISKFWSYGPAISWPIFEAGRIRSNIKVQNERQKQALLTYEKTVLAALADVENALVACTTEQVRRRSLMDAVNADHRSVYLAKDLYMKGLVDFLNILDAERSLYSSEDNLAQSDINVSINLVALYKALGGGWEIDPESVKISQAKSSSIP